LDADWDWDWEAALCLDASSRLKPGCHSSSDPELEAASELLVASLALLERSARRSRMSSTASLVADFEMTTFSSPNQRNETSISFYE